MCKFIEFWGFAVLRTAGLLRSPIEFFNDVHDFLLPHLLLPQESVDLLLIYSLLLPLILIVVIIALRMLSYTALF